MACRAFTLLEILLVLALIGLLTGLFSVGFSRVMTQHGATAPDDVFWESCHAAQELATLSEHDVLLSFDPKQKAFIVTDGSKTDLHPVTTAGEMGVQFLQAQKNGGSTILIGGQLIETSEIPSVTFYPDGTCTPFRVQFRLPGGPLVLSIDPWTCAPVLAAADKNH